MSATRRTVTDVLTKASQSWLLHYMFSTFVEISIGSKDLRADVIGIRMNGEIVICEVKSSWEDFQSDKKWQEYLPHCNRFYFVFSSQTWVKNEARIVKNIDDRKAGVLVLDSDVGYLKVARRARREPMLGGVKRDLVYRLAWRNGVSLRNSHRVRYFIKEDEATCP